MQILLRGDDDREPADSGDDDDDADNDANEVRVDVVDNAEDIDADAEEDDDEEDEYEVGDTAGDSWWAWASLPISGELRLPPAAQDIPLLEEIVGP